MANDGLAGGPFVPLMCIQAPPPPIARRLLREVENNVVIEKQLSKFVGPPLSHSSFPPPPYSIYLRRKFSCVQLRILLSNESLLNHSALPLTHAHGLKNIWEEEEDASMKAEHIFVVHPEGNRDSQS